MGEYRLINQNAKVQKARNKQKRQNAYNNRRYERIVATEQNYNTYVYNNITVLLEDDGYAFDYTAQLLKKAYDFLNFDLIGAHGEGCIHHLISYINTDLLILVYDKSNNIKLLQNINTEIKAFKSRNNKSKVITIMPKAFEEIILSYTGIENLIKTNNSKGISLLHTINDYVTGKIKDYSLVNYILKAERVNDDMILEDWIEMLTSNTDYYCTHKPSRISNCWLNDCNSCNNKSSNCNTIIPMAIKHYTAKSKIEYIALNSLAYFITKAIDEYIGHKYRTTVCNLLDEKNIMEEV